MHILVWNKQTKKLLTYLYAKMYLVWKNEKTDYLLYLQNSSSGNVMIFLPLQNEHTGKTRTYVTVGHSEGIPSWP